ncbi:hypothetical protein [Sphingobium abikonense]|jgi:hypothetical protein|uniref:hypothetical protein n=1 Tax=Sphingobium abikonense TaxID=86193 RepID=UPI00351139C1
MKYLSFTLAIFSSISANGEKPPLSGAHTKACEVSLSFAKDFVKSQDGRVIFNSWEGPSQAKVSKVEKYDWGITTYGHSTGSEKPSSNLIRKFHQQRGISAVEECPLLRSYLTESNVEFGFDATIRATNDPSKSNFLILSIALPAVSDDGKEAVLSNGQTGVHGGGGGWMTALSLDQGGHWKATYVAPTWIA